MYRKIVKRGVVYFFEIRKLKLVAWIRLHSELLITKRWQATEQFYMYHIAILMTREVKNIVRYSTICTTKCIK